MVVLLADDNRLLLSVIASVLRIGGHKVLTADSGEEALRLAQEQHPDAAIIDFYMPRISGEDVARQCGRLGIPFVFLSAYDDAGTRKVAYDLGARGYLVKPAAREDLLAALARCAHP